MDEATVAAVPPAAAGPLVAVGRIVRTQGRRGEVRVEPLSDRAEERFRAGSRLISAVGEVTVVSVRGTAQDPIVHFRGIDDREAAERLRGELRDAIEAGLPAYAECGGLMYLARGIEWNGRRAGMVGVIPADIVMHRRPVGRGYVHLRETGRSPWRQVPQAPLIHAHEFHYSSVENLAPDVAFAYEVERGYGIDGRHDGIVHRNLLASYAHLRDVADNRWARRFVEFARRCAAQRAASPGVPA